MALLLAFLVFITVSSLMVVGSWYFTHDPQLHDRLNQFTFTSKVSSLREMELRTSIIQRIGRPLLLRLGQFLSKFSPQGYRDGLRQRLLLAGSPGNLQASEFLAIKVSLFSLFGLFIFVFGPLMILGSALGWYLPELLLKSKIQKRQKLIQNSLSDTLDLLCVSVEAGLGFDGAIAKVVEKSTGPLTDEFSRLLQEIRIGKPRRVALRDVTFRTGVADLNGFISAIIQADQLGIPISNVLRIQSQEIRRKRRQRAEEQAMKAPIKMLFPLIFFIFPAIFVVLLGPALIRMVETLGKLIN
jgi:tight adherence protein C